MRALTRPKPEHIYDPQVEIDNLIQHRDAVPADVTRNRNIPAPGQSGKLLLASWNIANLGVHKRRSSNLKVIAAILCWFEIVAIQGKAGDRPRWHLLNKLNESSRPSSRDLAKVTPMQDPRFSTDSMP
jgi:hypothetical protein